MGPRDDDLDLQSNNDNLLTPTAAANSKAPQPQILPSFSDSALPTRRVLITGGSGFLGFRLAKALTQQGVEVVLLDLYPPSQPLPAGIRFSGGSVVDAAAVDAAICSFVDDSDANAAAANASHEDAAAKLPPGASPRMPHINNPTGDGSLKGGRASGGGGRRGGAPVDAVFHVASYGMSGRELRNRDRIEAVNVGGTRIVVEACLRHGVPRLVYVSTCNVIFVGRPISGGDETAPYPPPSAYKDHYSATKARAERLVLEANGRPLQPRPGPHAPATSGPLLQPCRGPRATAGQEVSGPGMQRGVSAASGSTRKGQDGQPEQGRQPEQCGGQQENRAATQRLATCCIRSTGIWGAGETRHQPRVIRMVRAGLFLATFGSRNSITDWVHVDNLVDMLILAEGALRAPRAPAPNTATGPAVVAPANDGPGHTAELDSSSPTVAGLPVAAGQVYYASDGAPLNNFDHFKPFIVGLGYAWPRLNLPYSVMYGIAALIEFTWPLLRHFVNDPLLIRMEIDKSCIEHWFDIGKARRELGYVPKVYGRQEVIEQMAAEGWSAAAVAAEQQQRQWRLLLVLLIAVLAAVVAVAVGAVGRRGVLSLGTGR